MKFPPALFRATIASVEQAMPPGVGLTAISDKLVAVTVTSQLAATVGRQDHRPRWLLIVGAPSRMGISTRSLEWAQWHMLDSLLRMSRACDLPWSAETSRDSRIVTSRSDSVTCVKIYARDAVIFESTPLVLEDQWRRRPFGL